MTAVSIGVLAPRSRIVAKDAARRRLAGILSDFYADNVERLLSEEIERLAPRDERVFVFPCISSEATVRIGKLQSAERAERQVAGTMAQAIVDRIQATASDSGEVRVFESETHFAARYIRYRLERGDDPAWVFEPFDRFNGLAPGDAAMALLLAVPARIPGVVAELVDIGAWNRLTRVLSEHYLQKIWRTGVDAVDAGPNGPRLPPCENPDANSEAGSSRSPALSRQGRTGAAGEQDAGIDSASRASAVPTGDRPLGRDATTPPSSPPKPDKDGRSVASSTQNGAMDETSPATGDRETVPGAEGPAQTRNNRADLTSIWRTAQRIAARMGRDGAESDEAFERWVAAQVVPIDWSDPGSLANFVASALSWQAGPSGRGEGSALVTELADWMRSDFGWFDLDQFVRAMEQGWTESVDAGQGATGAAPSAPQSPPADGNDRVPSSPPSSPLAHQPLTARQRSALSDVTEAVRALARSPNGGRFSPAQFGLRLLAHLSHGNPQAPPGPYARRIVEIAVAAAVDLRAGEDGAAAIASPDATADAPHRAEEWRERLEGRLQDIRKRLAQAPFGNPSAMLVRLAAGLASAGRGDRVQIVQRFVDTARRMGHDGRSPVGALDGSVFTEGAAPATQFLEGLCEAIAQALPRLLPDAVTAQGMQVRSGSADKGNAAVDLEGTLAFVRLAEFVGKADPRDQADIICRIAGLGADTVHRASSAVADTTGTRPAEPDGAQTFLKNLHEAITQRVQALRRTSHTEMSAAAPVADPGSIGASGMPGGVTESGKAAFVRPVSPREILQGLGSEGEALYRAVVETAGITGSSARAVPQGGAWIETPYAGLYRVVRGILDSRICGVADALSYPAGEEAGRPSAFLQALILRLSAQADRDPAVAMLCDPERAVDPGFLRQSWAGSRPEANVAFQGELLRMAAAHGLAECDCLDLRCADWPGGGDVVLGGSADRGVWPLGALCAAESPRFDVGPWLDRWKATFGEAPDRLRTDDEGLADRLPGNMAIELDKDLPGGDLSRMLSVFDNAALGLPGADLNLSLAAAFVLRVWSRWLSGFQDSSVPYLIESFVHRPGRVRWSARTGFEVEIDDNGLETLIKMAGYHDNLENVPWLKGRGIRFGWR